MGARRTGYTTKHLSMVYSPHRLYQKWVLMCLNFSGKHIYAGTVPEKEVRRRRAANKVARRQRGINVRRGHR